MAIAQVAEGDLFSIKRIFGESGIGAKINAGMPYQGKRIDPKSLWENGGPEGVSVPVRWALQEIDPGKASLVGPSEFASRKTPYHKRIDPKVIFRYGAWTHIIFPWDTPSA